MSEYVIVKKIIQCKECKHWDSENTCCKILFLKCEPSDFCPRGEISEEGAK